MAWQLPAALLAGKHFLLRSFFELLLHLQRTRRDFGIVFRTFGTDSFEVATELNLFCAGQHPLYKGLRMDGAFGLYLCSFP